MSVENDPELWNSPQKRDVNKKIVTPVEQEYHSYIKCDLRPKNAPKSEVTKVVGVNERQDCAWAWFKEAECDSGKRSFTPKPRSQSKEMPPVLSVVWHKLMAYWKFFWLVVLKQTRGKTVHKHLHFFYKCTRTTYMYSMWEQIPDIFQNHVLWTCGIRMQNGLFQK